MRMLCVTNQDQAITEIVNYKKECHTASIIETGGIHMHIHSHNQGSKDSAKFRTLDECKNNRQATALSGKHKKC